LQVRLAVAGAFHTQYMAPAAEKLQEALNNTAISTPRIPVISNVDAQPHSDPAVIKDILTKQVRSLGRCHRCRIILLGTSSAWIPFANLAVECSTNHSPATSSC
jgi:hypothetical protein